jgi:hypothetical protein
MVPLGKELVFDGAGRTFFISPCSTRGILSVMSSARALVTINNAVMLKRAEIVRMYTPVLNFIRF